MANFAKGYHSSQSERLCKYIHRYCNQTRLVGYDYCIRHILEDKSAPFKQCVYVNQPNKKRCTNAAPKSDKSEKRDNVLCPFHTKRAMLKVRISAPRKKPIEGPAAFLKSLEHYCKDANHDPSHKRDSGPSDRSDVPLCEGGGPTTLSDVESAIDDAPSIDAKARIDTIDDDFCWVEKYGDCLENAGVYTYKEVLTIAQEKILRLQQLYCEELKVVYHQLRESRRKFLSELKNENQDKISSESPQQVPNETMKTSLHALMQHHRRSRVERVLRHRVQMKRLNAGKPPLPKQKCSYEKLGNKCTNDVIVSTNYCKIHILLDPNQLLYKPCPFGLKEKCLRPVLVVEEDVSCDLHLHRLLKSKLEKPIESSPSPEPTTSKTFQLEPEPFQSMDDIASLGLDAIAPGSLFGLDQFGEPGESTDTVMSEDQADLLQIQPISLNPPADILYDSRKTESE